MPSVKDYQYVQCISVGQTYARNTVLTGFEQLTPQHRHLPRVWQWLHQISSDRHVPPNHQFDSKLCPTELLAKASNPIQTHPSDSDGDGDGDGGGGGDTRQWRWKAGPLKKRSNPAM